MVKLIKYFNKNYGQQYGNVEYPRTKKEIYQTYQIIKAYGIKDDTLMNLLNAIVLPKPKTIKEKEMFSECLYEVGKETLPQISFNENGELVVTIGEITKIFVSKDVIESSISSITPTVDESTGILKIGN